jgi:hypothetical protein
MHASHTLLVAALAAAVNATPPSGPPKPPSPSDLPKLPKPPGPPGKGNDTNVPTCTYAGPDDGKFDYSAISLREVGARNTLDWRIWLLHKCNPISFWHDVPLYPYENDTTIINAVVEIPRWTDGKIEIESEEPLTPIFHDDRNDAPRFVESVWPHRSYPFVYGSVSFPPRIVYIPSVVAKHPIRKKSKLITKHKYRSPKPGKTPTSATPSPTKPVTTTRSTSSTSGRTQATLARSDSPKFWAP